MSDRQWMFRALELAERGQGAVEPNPMVGCVLVHADQVIAEGWHRRFGEQHAEVDALERCSVDPKGATAYVTLEPCCHFGKQPPCTHALIRAGIERVVVAMADPFAEVDGGGVSQLEAAGIKVEVGLLEERARYLNAPYLKLVQKGQPWLIAKWAATMDGKIATSQSDSRWISNESSRAIVHQIRGRCDAIIVGAGTATSDDPLMTVRPPGLRSPVRIVISSEARLGLDSNLVKTLDEAPVWVVCGPDADAGHCNQLRDRGVDVIQFAQTDANQRLTDFMDYMGKARMTNVLIEGGSQLLGSFFDLRHVDEVHAFFAPKLAGGAAAPTAIGGAGVPTMAQVRHLGDPILREVDGDLYWQGRIRY